MPPKNNTPKTEENLGIFSRFVAVWTHPNFLSDTILKEKSSGKTWGFWFFWNTVVVLILALSLWVSFSGPTNKFVQNTLNELPISEISLIDGEFSMIPDTPITWTTPDSNDYGIFIDISGNTYDREVLKKYHSGLWMDSKEIFIKDAKSYESIFFHEIPENFSLTSQETKVFWEEYHSEIFKILALIAFVLLWIFVCLFRLLIALWWSFLVWLGGKIFDIPDLDFGKSYLAVMHFYLVPLIIESALFFGFGFAFPYSTTLFLFLIIGLNFWYIKKGQS